MASCPSSPGRGGSVSPCHDVSTEEPFVKKDKAFSLSVPGGQRRFKADAESCLGADKTHTSGTRMLWIGGECFGDKV